MYQATTVTANLAVAGIFYFFLALYAPGKPSAVSNRFGDSRSSNNNLYYRLRDDVLVHVEAEAQGVGEAVACNRAQKGNSSRG